MNDELEEVVDATIKEISLVTTPANGEEFAMKKSLFEDGEEPTLEEMTKGVDGDLAVLLAEALDVDKEKMMDVIESMDGLIKMKFSRVVEVLSEEMNQKKEDIAETLLNGLGEQMERSFEESDNEETQKNTNEESSDMSEEDIEEDTEKSDSQTEGGQEMAEEEQVEEEAEKDLPEDVEKQLERLEELQKKQEQTEEELQKERERRIRKEYIEKARTDFDVVAKEADELGPVLKEIDENLSEETAEEVKSLIKTGYEQAEQAGLFEKAGTPAGQSDAASEVEKKVEEKMEKGDYDSEAAARADVWSENPELAEKVRS